MWWEEIILHRLWRGRRTRTRTIPDENIEVISSEELTPMISCNELDRNNTPQTINIEGYIKNKKLIVLIDSGSNHNFIHYKLAKALNCFVYPAQSFK